MPHEDLVRIGDQYVMSILYHVPAASDNMTSTSIKTNSYITPPHNDSCSILWGRIFHNSTVADCSSILTRLHISPTLFA